MAHFSDLAHLPLKLLDTPLLLDTGRTLRGRGACTMDTATATGGGFSGHGLEWISTKDYPVY